MERYLDNHRTIDQGVATYWLVHSIGIKKRDILVKDVSLGDPARARTEDPKIKSLLLYQLSYGVKKWSCKYTGNLFCRKFLVFIFVVLKKASIAQLVQSICLTSI